MKQTNNKVVDYFNSHQKEVVDTLLPKTLNDLNITFTEQDLNIHIEMLYLLLDRVTASILSSREETSKMN